MSCRSTCCLSCGYHPCGNYSSIHKRCPTKSLPPGLILGPEDQTNHCSLRMIRYDIFFFKLFCSPSKLVHGQMIDQLAIVIHDIDSTIDSLFGEVD